MATGMMKMSDNDDIDAIRPRNKVPTLVLKVSEMPPSITSNPLEDKSLLCLLDNGMGRYIWCKISKNALKYVPIFQKDAVLRIKNATAREREGPQLDNVSNAYLLLSDFTEVTLMQKEGNSSYIVAPFNSNCLIDIDKLFTIFAVAKHAEQMNPTVNRNSSSASSSGQIYREMATTSSTADGQREKTVSAINNETSKPPESTEAMEDDADDSFAKQFSDALSQLSPEKKWKCKSLCLDVLSNLKDD